MRLGIAVVVALAGCTDETISGYADRDVTYALIELDGAPFLARATITFPKPGSVRGQGPCNAWSAAQTAPYPWFQLGDISATKRACPDMGAEAEFFAGMQETRLVEVSGPILILSGTVEMVFEAE